MQLFLFLKGEMMNPETCKFCKYYGDLPFSDEFICENPNSDYADCPCSPDDTCSEWVGRNDEDVE